MRTFIALDIKSEIISYIAEIENALKSTAKDAVKWVLPQNMHLTLQFLGDINTPELSYIKDIIIQTSRKFSQFETRLGEIGFFPSNKKPRIIWLGLNESSPTSGKISEHLYNELRHLRSNQPTNKFHPHITLGRIKKLTSKKILLKKISNLSIDKSLSWRFSDLTLYQSTLTSKGPIYSKILTKKLRSL